MKQTAGDDMKKNKTWITLAEAVEEYPIAHSTLRKKIRLGLIKAYKPAKYILLERVELETFIRKSRIKFAS